MTLSYFPPKNWHLICYPSWSTNQRPVFLARNSLTSYSHLKSKPTMPVIINTNEILINELINNRIDYEFILMESQHYYFLNISW